MSRSPTHILYIAEFSTGGSVESLLCLVGGLDKQAFKATVLFYTMPNPAVCDRFRAGGAIDPVGFYRSLNYRENLEVKRPASANPSSGIV